MPPSADGGFRAVSIRWRNLERLYKEAGSTPAPLTDKLYIIEKIFDKDFRDALENGLIEAGIEKSEANRIIKENYQRQLKKVAIKRLEDIIECLRWDNYNSIPIQESPSGDGYGQDNYYIDFSDITDCEDIGDIINKLNDND